MALDRINGERSMSLSSVIIGGTILIIALIVGAIICGSRCKPSRDEHEDNSIG